MLLGTLDGDLGLSTSGDVSVHIAKTNAVSLSTTEGLYMCTVKLNLIIL